MNNFFNIAIEQNKPLRLMNGEIAYVKFQLPLPSSWGSKFVGYRITGKYHPAQFSKLGMNSARPNLPKISIFGDMKTNLRTFTNRKLSAELRTSKFVKD